ncbi:MAG: hypothetical protein ACAH95_11655 [Fimbriimonas sp.]
MRRTLTALLFSCLALSALAQKRDGMYGKTAWSINENHALIWGGQPYVPVGIRVDGTPAAVQAAKQSGVEDVLLDLPASGMGWKDTLAAVEAEKMRYLLRVSSLAPMAVGFAVEPQGYRVTGIEKKTTVTVALPGASSAYVILAAKRDGTVQSSARVPVINGKLTYEADPGPAYEHVLLIYPEMTSIEQPDFWEGLDAHRDALLASLKKNNIGSGLRGIVNPLGTVSELPGREVRFVPTSIYFRMELRNYMEQRYKNIETAVRSWSMGSSDVNSFDMLARLVPLWSGDRGVNMLLDPVTNKLYTADRRYSNAWVDITQVVSLAGARRFDRLVRALRSVADVPVIQEWAGWSAVYENATPAVDGIGMRAAGTTPSVIVESACRATSSLLRWKTNGWLLATDIDLGSGDVAGQVPLVLDDLAGLGARGYFLRGDNAKVLGTVKSEASRKAADTMLATTTITGIFYPENATNPANPQRIGGSRWWLPTPADGNRIDLGSNFFGYRLADQIAIWAKTPGRYKLRMAEPKKATFTTVDGSDSDPRFVKGGVEVALGQFPLLIKGTSEIPVPEPAFVETVTQFDKMMLTAQEEHRDIIEERILFRDHLNGFELNPGGNFQQLRQTLYKLAYKVSNYTWIEAERSQETNFSESAPYAGASSAHALILKTAIQPGPGGYYAEYLLPVRTPEDQEVWIAARIPAERRGSVSVFVAGQLMRLPDAPMALYGDGIGWYKLGTTKLAGGSSKLRIAVDSPGAEIAIDTILLMPGTFQPSAVMPPLPANVQIPN